MIIDYKIVVSDEICRQFAEAVGLQQDDPITGEAIQYSDAEVEIYLEKWVAKTINDSIKEKSIDAFTKDAELMAIESLKLAKADIRSQVQAVLSVN